MYDESAELGQDELDRLEREAERQGGKYGARVLKAIRKRRRDSLDASVRFMEDREFCAGMNLQVEEV